LQPFGYGFIIFSMITVVSGQEKGKSGLAKIVLLAILVGCVLFAAWVVRVNTHRYDVKLDTPVVFSVGNGQGVLQISSTWEKLELNETRNTEIGTWAAGFPGQDDVAVFYLDMYPISELGKDQIQKLASRFLPYPSKIIPPFRIAPAVTGKNKFSGYETSLLYRDREGTKILLQRIIFLSERATLTLTLTGPASEGGELVKWMETISDSLDVKVKNRSKRVI
jgi:hypothetical protein